jgi:hypothetical protein
MSEKLKPDNTGYKLDGDKNRLDLVPPDAVEALGRVLSYGAKKYPAHNWARGMAWSRPYAAAQRHLLAFWSGEDRDPESGLPHVEHALCCLAFLATYRVRGLGTDDRFDWPTPADVAPAPVQVQDLPDTVRSAFRALVRFRLPHATDAEVDAVINDYALYTPAYGR